jgi:hypothetical protein
MLVWLIDKLMPYAFEMSGNIRACKMIADII